MSMTYVQVKTEVQSWLLDLPTGAAAKIDSWVNEAVRDACKRHNFRFMESEVTDQQTAVNTRLLVAKPATWKEARSCPYYVNQDGTVREIGWGPSKSEMNRSYADRIPQETSTSAVDSGAPKYLLETDANLNVYPLPDVLSGWTNGNYRVSAPYWAFPAALSADADTNFFTTNHEYYLIWKTCALGFAWNRDGENSAIYDQKAELLFQKLKYLDKMSRLGDRLTLAANKNVFTGRSRTTRED
jgi:hypothetical protein